MFFVVVVESLSPWEKWVIRKAKEERERGLLLFEKMVCASYSACHSAC